jgi:hypothetical protein
VLYPHVTLWKFCCYLCGAPAGYSTELVPSVDCWGINILVTFHIICAALIDTMLMSLVFSRSVSCTGTHTWLCGTNLKCHPCSMHVQPGCMPMSIAHAVMLMCKRAAHVFRGLLTPMLACGHDSAVLAMFNPQVCSTCPSCLHDPFLSACGPLPQGGHRRSQCSPDPTGGQLVPVLQGG